MSEKQNVFRLGGLGILVAFLDFLICVFNGFAVGWMIYKAFIEKDIEYTDRMSFVGTALAATSIVAVFGTIGNLLLMAGIRFGVRFAGYRIALGIGSILLAWIMMFFLMPRPEKIMSEDNFMTYVWFLGVGFGYLVWLIGYWATIAMASYKSRRPA
ncbi:MAG: hypothetical protein Q8M16_10930 [Pirellulaceae bacterium]|nr:hypothetical protein [Pirellulaceae bacterium]